MVSAIGHVTLACHGNEAESLLPASEMNPYGPAGQRRWSDCSVNSKTDRAENLSTNQALQSLHRLQKIFPHGHTLVSDRAINIPEQVPGPGRNSFRWTILRVSRLRRGFYSAIMPVT